MPSFCFCSPQTETLDVGLTAGQINTNFFKAQHTIGCVKEKDEVPLQNEHFGLKQCRAVMALFQQPRDASEALSEGFFSAQVVS